ncbi:uncharacterized protein CCR75_005085 [Bremia lactucae]|uniref:Uncharacterized protein n=1 Tax=Bremia lactucae TaxID=4779 RepID=A0A976IM47_BRELC|nr:hypothetical protein CCR75_005085 [Bremia lactucae]
MSSNALIVKSVGSITRAVPSERHACYHTVPCMMALYFRPFDIPPRFTASYCRSGASVVGQSIGYGFISVSKISAIVGDWRAASGSVKSSELARTSFFLPAISTCNSRSSSLTFGVVYFVWL